MSTQIEPAATVADPPVDAAPRRGGGRLQFLDALRGIAATSVLCQHAAEFLWPSYERWSHEIFRPGEFGVILFFLCSGFIIPASVERHSSLSRFWIGRAFRLFPLYWACLIATLVLQYGFDRPMLDPRYKASPVPSTLGNATMLQNFMNQPLFNGATWSLAYEMVFYFLISLLFLAGWHRRSVAIAVIGLVAALVVGPHVPYLMVSEGDGSSWLLVALATLAAAGLFLTQVRADVWTRVLVIGLAVLIVPFFLNRHEPMWFATLLIASMFVGTVLYRWTRGELSGRTAAAVYCFALGVIVVVHMLSFPTFTGPQNSHITPRVEIVTFLGAYLIFGAALLLRHRRFPRVLTYLGAISYSIYLLHVIVLYAVPWVSGNLPATWLRWVALTILLSMCTYHGIEKPFIQIGRRVEARYAAARERAAAPAP
jgi:peptidoglycan/LPS O-acetylase OafA/YrhL